MAVIDADGLFKGKRIRKCSAEARWYWPYIFLLSNGHARIELDYECIAAEFSSFRGYAPKSEQIQQAFAEYRANHLIFVYTVNDQEWGQWDTRRSLLKDYKTVADNHSPEPPESEYRPWLIEQHGEDWPQFHWNKSIAGEPFDRDSAKSSPKVRGNFPADCCGVGKGIGVGDGKTNCTKAQNLPPLKPGKKARNSKVGQGSTGSPARKRGEPYNVEQGLSATPARNETFDGEDWCLRTVKLHPKWTAPDAVSVPWGIQAAYMEAVESHAGNFNGDLRLAAEDMIARMRQFAKDMAGQELVTGTLNFFVKGVHMDHQPSKSAEAEISPELRMNQEEIEETAKREADEKRKAWRERKQGEAAA